MYSQIEGGRVADSSKGLKLEKLVMKNKQLIPIALDDKIRNANILADQASRLQE